MKAHLMIALCCVLLLCCTTATFGQTRLDIALEGPWILYEDQNLFAGVTVLVALAPGVPEQTKPHVFHRPTVATGDGYGIPGSGVYCLIFDKRCGRKGPPRLVSDGYPATMPLSVKVTTPAKWNWASTNQKKSGTALILPMPDSYSNNGAWPMRFGMRFDSTGNKYVEVGGPRHSIGIQLHYSVGPTVLDLVSCAV